MKTDLLHKLIFSNKLPLRSLLLLLMLLSVAIKSQTFNMPYYIEIMGQSPICRSDSSIAIDSMGHPQVSINTYNSNGKLTNVKGLDSQRNLIDEYNFSYNSDDSLVKKIYTNIWYSPFNTSKNVLVRNSVKQIVSDTTYYATNTSTQYTPMAVSNYSYDTGGNISEIDRYTFNGSWSPYDRQLMQRNSAGKVTNLLLQEWKTGIWKNLNQYNYTYNTNNDLVKCVVQGWNNTFWLDNLREIYSSPGTIDTITVESWYNSQWTDYRSYIRTWSAGRLTSITQKIFTSAWNNYDKNEYFYDSNGNNINTKTYYFLSSSNVWDLSMDVYHYYSCAPVGISEYEIREIRTYPVPTTGMLYFDESVIIKTGLVYAASDVELLNFVGNSVDLSQLAPGIYYVKLQLESGANKVVKAVKE